MPWGLRKAYYVHFEKSLCSKRFVSAIPLVSYQSSAKFQVTVIHGWAFHISASGGHSKWKGSYCNILVMRCWWCTTWHFVSQAGALLKDVWKIEQKKASDEKGSGSPLNHREILVKTTIGIVVGLLGMKYPTSKYSYVSKCKKYTRCAHSNPFTLLLLPTPTI